MKHFQIHEEHARIPYHSNSGCRIDNHFFVKNHFKHTVFPVRHCSNWIRCATARCHLPLDNGTERDGNCLSYKCYIEPSTSSSLSTSWRRSHHNTRLVWDDFWLQMRIVTFQHIVFPPGHARAKAFGRGWGKRFFADRLCSSNSWNGAKMLDFVIWCETKWILCEIDLVSRFLQRREKVFFYFYGISGGAKGGVGVRNLPSPRRGSIGKVLPFKKSTSEEICFWRFDGMDRPRYWMRKSQSVSGDDDMKKVYIDCFPFWTVYWVFYFVDVIVLLKCLVQ